MRFLLLKIFIFLNVSIFAQGWKKIFHLPNTENNAAKAIFETTPGNYIALGSVLDTTNGGYSNKLCVMGLSAQGQLLWTKKYGNYKLFYTENNFITRWGYKQGNALFYTCCALDTNNKQVGVLIKFSLNGDTLWQKIFRDSTQDFIPQRVTGSVDGGLLITGFFQDWTNPIRPFLIVKTDINGNELWRRKIHKSVPDVMDGKGILQDSASKKIVAVGYQYIGNSNYQRSYDNILIMDSVGNKITQINYTTMGGLLQDVIQTRDGKFVAAGAKTYTVDGYGDDVMQSYIVKFDINNPNPLIWSKANGGRNAGEYSCLTELENQNLLLGATLDTAGDHLITQIDQRDKNGNLLLSSFYDYSGQDTSVSNMQRIQSLTPTSDHGRVAAILDLNSTNNPYFFVKYDSLGCDSTLAYCTMLATGIKNISPSSDLVSVYPNPCKSQLNIDFRNTEAVHSVNSVFYDVSGRAAKRLRLEKTDNSIDVSELEDGLYILKIEDPITKMQHQIKVLKRN